MSNQTAKRGLSVKDLVTIGIFTALMLVFSMVGGIFFAPNPVLTFYMPVGSAILCGPIYLLLIAKVKKRFAITIVGALIGIIVGAVVALAVAIVGNIIVTPFYAHMTTAQVVALIVPALLPFNALKFTIHGVVTFLIYKPISNLLNR